MLTSELIENREWEDLSDTERQLLYILGEDEHCESRHLPPEPKLIDLEALAETRARRARLELKVAEQTERRERQDKRTTGRKIEDLRATALTIERFNALRPNKEALAALHRHLIEDLLAIEEAAFKH